MASEVRILVIDDDAASQAALRQMLDAEGWEVEIVPMVNQGLAALAAGGWVLVIVNVGLCGPESLLFHMLRELALAEPVEGEKARVRTLFLVPEMAGQEVEAALERDRLPYIVKPLHLHDFLERVSDLLMETSAIAAPIRKVQYMSRSAGRAKKGSEKATQGRQTQMFTARDEYQMTEEEITEYERQEQEETQRKKKKRDIGLP